MLCKNSGNSFNIKVDLIAILLHRFASDAVMQQVQLDALNVKEGSPKVYEDNTAKSGKTVHRNFCGDCGTALWSSPESQPGVTWLKVGPLSIVDKVKMDLEIFCENASPNTLRCVILACSREHEADLAVL